MGWIFSGQEKLVRERSGLRPHLKKLLEKRKRGKENQCQRPEGAAGKVAVYEGCLVRKVSQEKEAGTARV